MRWNLMNFYLVVLVKLNMPTIFFMTLLSVYTPEIIESICPLIVWVIWSLFYFELFIYSECQMNMWKRNFPMCRLPLHKWQFLWLFLSFYISCNPIAITIFFWSPCLRLWIEVFPLLILISLEISCVKLKSLMHFE